MLSQARRSQNEITVKKFGIVDLFAGETNQIPISFLGAGTVLLLSINILLHSIAIFPAAFIAACVSWAWYGHLSQSYPAFRNRLRQRKGRARLVAIGLFSLLLVTVLAHPAHAQFFGDAESWMESNFGGNTGDAIPLVFNVLRGLFLLYVGISLVRVINSARQDEDWQTIARTPLIIIIAVTAADVLTTLITG